MGFKKRKTSLSVSRGNPDKARMTRNTASATTTNNDAPNPSSSSFAEGIPFRARACKTASAKENPSAKQLQKNLIKPKPKPVLDVDDDANETKAVIISRPSLLSEGGRRKRKRLRNYARKENTGNDRAKQAIKRARQTIQFTNSSQNRELAKPDLWNEIDSFVQVKEEVVDEVDLNKEDDDFISLHVTAEKDLEPEILSEGSRCLICFNLVLDPRPLKGILPKSKRLTNPDQLEDDLRIIHVLKMIFQWTTTELNNLMRLSNGQSPRDWIHLCQSCRLLIFKIQTLEDRMRDCRKKIKDTIIKSAEILSLEPESITTRMTRRIRCLVNQQVTSARENTVFNDGDRQAKELVDLQMNWKRCDSPLEMSADEFESEHFSCPDSPHCSANLSMDMEMNESSGDIDIKPDSVANPLNEQYLCPVCHADANGFFNSKRMDIVDFCFHLLFHHDHPMKCSECKVFLPKDPQTLDAHWNQFHSDMKTSIPAMRYAEINIGKENPLIPPCDSSCDNANEWTILCADCWNDEDLQVKFDSMDKLKIHQALKHPSVARFSCPLCPTKFSEGNNFELEVQHHLRSIHKVDGNKSKMCKFCGFGVRISSTSEFAESLHMVSNHKQLTKDKFKCEVDNCLKEFSTLKEFLGHATLIPHHAIPWEKHAEHLFKFESNLFTCGICIGDKITLESENSLISHLKLVHSLSLKWEDGASICLAPSIVSSAVRFEKVTKTKPEIKGKVSRVKPKKSTQETRFACQTCPDLKKMNLDAFIAHLIFHWRRPIRCTSCKSHLPFVPEVIDLHWQRHHPGLDSQTEVKFEPVQSSAGKVFKCEKCPRKFETFKERNEHEQSRHKWDPSRTTVCSVCYEGFINTEELRLHRAMDHPEVASIGCYYCEELFPAESLEGIQYLDCEALKQHFSDKEDHPKEDGKIFHLYACDLCGEVIKGYTKKVYDLKRHYSLKHPKHEMLFSCFICHKNFAYENKWMHLSNTHAKNIICEMCGEDMRPFSLPLHMIQKHDILMEGYRKYACDKPGCNFATVYHGRFATHAARHRNEDNGRLRQYKCGFCDKAFFTKGHFKEHEKRHQPHETRQFQCEVCGSTYTSNRDLQQHRSTHPNLESSKCLKCDYCGYYTAFKIDLRRHIERIHKNGSRKPRKIVCFFGCNAFFKNLNQFDDHLVNVHSMELEKEHLIFQSEEEFEQWRDTLKERESSAYMSWTHNKASMTKTFLCNRSSVGARPSQGKNLRKAKTSIVSDKVCRSRLVVTQDKNDGTWKVTYFKTHTGHDIEPGKIGLSEALKRKIAEDIMNGATKKQILEKLREGQGEYSGVTRGHLINREDIDNICRKYKLSAAFDVRLTSSKKSNRGGNSARKNQLLNV